MSASETVHASCVLVDEGGILIQGASGTGKSTLALALLELADRQGSVSRLVGDDRIHLCARGGRLVARGVPAVAGRIEARGIGILPVAFEAAVVVKLVINLSDETPPRMPEPTQSTTLMRGIAVACVTSRIGPGLESSLLRRYRALDDTLMME